MKTKGKWLVMTAMLAGVAAGAFAPAVQAADDGAVVIVVPDEPATLEPCSAGRGNIGRVIKNNVTETLLDVVPDDGSLRPRLAKSWKQVDPATWQFSLVENAAFTDGAPFNAEAVVFNVERWMNKALACQTMGKAFSGYALSATAIDGSTVEIKADKPAPLLATSLALLPIVSPNTAIDTATREPIGTGPYKLVEWIEGDHITLERNAGYWGAAPQVAKATYVFRGDSAVRAAMVQTGEADLAPDISEQDATDQALDSAYLNSETTRLRIDPRFAPLDDIRVRQALNYAVDRAAMQGSVVSAKAIQSAQMVVPGINGHNNALVPLSYNPEKARELVAAAKADGVPVDTQIRLIGRIDNFPGIAEFMQALEAMFTDVGLNVKLEMIDSANHALYQVQPMPENPGPNLIEEMHDNNQGDAYFTVDNKYHSTVDGRGGGSVYAYPELDALMDKANAATGDERRATFQEIFRLLHDKYVTDVDLFHMVSFSRVGPRLDYKPSLLTNSQIELQEIKLK